MTIINETAYPQLKSQYSSEELLDLFTPARQEILLMQNNTRETSFTTQFCFVALLKCYQCIGQPILIHEVPKQVLVHITQFLNMKNLPKKLSYNKSTRQRHVEVIRNHLNIVSDNKTRRKCMKEAALDAATTKEGMTDIINNVIDCLVKGKFEIPSFHSLLRLSRASRKVITESFYRKISTNIDKKTKSLIDTFFIVGDDESSSINSLWWQIKQEPKSPTAKNMNIFMNHLDWLMDFHEKINIDLDFIPHARLEQFVSDAISLDAADMKK